MEVERIPHPDDRWLPRSIIELIEIAGARVLLQPIANALQYDLSLKVDRAFFWLAKKTMEIPVKAASNTQSSRRV